MFYSIFCWAVIGPQTKTKTHKRMVCNEVVRNTWPYTPPLTVIWTDRGGVGSERIGIGSGISDYNEEESSKHIGQQLLSLLHCIYDKLTMSSAASSFCYVNNRNWTLSGRHATVDLSRSSVGSCISFRSAKFINKITFGCPRMSQSFPLIPETNYFLVSKETNAGD